ncbi:MAG: response regulator [Rhodospirillales bacterium]|nr:response regulator [Rhodospirillales bacterium]
MARILVIEDDQDVRAMVVRALSRAGHEMFEAADGSDGLSVFGLKRPDMVITDIFMPGMDGLETTRILLEIDPNLRIMAMSGGGPSQRMEYLEHAQTFGACGIIAKPFLPSELVAKVDEMLAS